MLPPVSVLLLAVLVIPSSVSSVPVGPVDVTIFGNAAKGSPEELKRVEEAVYSDLGIRVRLHVHNVLVSWSDQSAPVDFDALARDIRRSQIVVLDNMGPLPGPFVEELSARVLGRPVADVSSFFRELAREKRLVACVTGDQHDFILFGPGCRRVRDNTAAVANLGFLFRFSDSLVPVVEYLLWLAYPDVPAERLRLSSVRVSFVAAYVPGRGWVFPEVPGAELEGAYHRWLRRLAAGERGLWFEVRLAILPSWVRGLRERCLGFLRSLELPGRRLVVVLGYVDALYKGESGLVERVVEEIRGELARSGLRDVGVVALLCDGNVVPPVDFEGRGLLQELRRLGYEVAAVVSLWAFTMNYPYPAAWALRELDAPVIKVVYPFWSDWACEPWHYLDLEKDAPNSGLVGAVFEWGYQVIGGPEAEGAFWFKLCALKRSDRMSVFPLRDMVRDLARLVVGFVRLRYLPESRKRVAFVLYCYPPGRDAIGAAYLDVFRSLINVLAAMVERGYDLGPAGEVFRRVVELRRRDPKEAEAFEDRLAHALMEAADLVLKNVGPWAKGELAGMVRLYRGGRAERVIRWKSGEMRVIVEGGRVVWVDVDGRSYVLGTVGPDQLVPVEELERWYREDVLSRFRYYLSLLRGDDERVRRAREALERWMRAVEERFGPPSDNRGIMRWDRYYVIPALRLGNVVITLQPVRGWSGSPELVYHSPDLPPQWQYIAAYEWLRRVFRADAVVHVGTHGTLEWLPGHQVGLLGVDWPHVLLPDVPHFYVYIVSNPGEAMVAKYRSGPVLLTHLPPTWSYFRDFERYDRLWREVTRYLQLRMIGGDPRMLGELRKRIVEEAGRLGLLRTVVDAILSERGGEARDPRRWALEHFDEFVSKLHDFLLDLALSNVAYGLHVYGRGPDREAAIREAGVLASSMPDVNAVFAYYAGLIEQPDPGELERFRAEHPDAFAGFKRRLRECLARLLREILLDPGLVRGLDEYVRWKDLEEYYGWRPRLTNPATRAFRGFRDRLVELARRAVLETFGAVREDREYEHLLAEAAARVYRIYAHYLRSGESELENLLRGLDGRFVPPGLLGEPMWNPAVLPTGRDGYPIDPNMLPTPEAWEVAKRLVDEFLARYYREHRSWPEAVGVVIWGVHELCTGGLNIAMVLYLLGVRPVWDPDSGRVIGVELIPLRDLRVRVDGRWLRRPRIDVVVWAALHMEAPLKLLADAFYLVSHVDEPSELNYRRRHYLELRPRVEEELRRLGYSAREARELADVIASSGYFAQPPGVFTGAGASDVVEHAWTDVSGTVGVLEGPSEALRRFQERFWERFREACEARMAYVYSARARIVVVRQGERVRVMVLRTSTDEVYHAIPSVTAFRYLMSKVRAVVHSVVNTWGLIDTDDFYDWVGGMALYATFASGRAPEVYIANAIDPTAACTRSAFEQLAGEVYTKLLSPSWWNAMLRHGDYGWSRVARRIEFLAGWGITVPSLRAPLNGLYTRVASRLLEELSRHPPSTEYGWASVVSSLAWFVELARLGVWQPRDRSVLVRVAQTLLRVMARHGPATCHHTSPNPALVAYAVRVLLEAGYSYSEIAGLVNQVLEWYQRLDNPEIVRQIRTLLREVLRRYGRPGTAAPGSASPGARSSSVQGARSGPSGVAPTAVGRRGVARARGGSPGSAARPSPFSSFRSALGAAARAVTTSVRAVVVRAGSVSVSGGASGPSGRAGSGLGGRGGRTVTIGVRGAPISGRLSAGRVGGGAAGSSGSVSRASAVGSVSAARGAVGRSAASGKAAARAASTLSRAAAQASSSVRRIWEWVLALVLTVLIVSGWVAARRGVVARGPRW